MKKTVCSMLGTFVLGLPACDFSGTRVGGRSYGQ